MCGIVGVLTGTDNKYCLKEIVNNMAEKIVHRGPDNTGIYFDKNISFCCAHQRLSILDLSNAGNQPMLSFHKRLVISFNGEIYNFRELKQKLNLETKIIWKGNSDFILHHYKLSSRTDTEFWKYYSQFDVRKSLWENYHNKKNKRTNLFSNAIWATLGVYFNEFTYYG